jgi:hypothetical protein
MSGRGSSAEWSPDNHLREAERLELEAEADTATSKARIPEFVFGPWWIVGLVTTTLILAAAYFFYIGDMELPRYIENLPPKDLLAAKDRWEVRALFGEEWGAFAALMSGLSIAFVALSLLGQRRELTMNRIELSLQRSELKQTRAQAHRQLAEMKLSRLFDIRQARYTLEPVLHVHRLGIGPSRSDIALTIELFHIGAPVWNVHVFSCLTQDSKVLLPWTKVSTPVVVAQPTSTVNTVLKVGSQVDFGGLDQLPDSITRFWIFIAYQNIAGGKFVSTQFVEVPKYILKTAVMDWQSPVQYRSIALLQIASGDEIDLTSPPPADKLVQGMRTPSEGVD